MRKIASRKQQATPISFAVLLLTAALCFGAEPAAVSSLDNLRGAWKDPASGNLLAFEPDRIIAFSDHALSVRGVVSREFGRVVLRHQGLLETWALSLNGNTLRVSIDGKDQDYQSLESVPSEVQLRPAAIGEAKGLSPDKISAVQKALAERAAKGQAVRQDRSRWPEMAAVDAENTRFLKDLIQEVGWIDLGRFGVRTAQDAFLLVQHSADLPLMMASIPFIEKDFKHSEGAQSFALLYDRLQLDLGQRQLYGTQIGMDKSGNPFLFALEDPGRVDERLKDLGLPPLREYLVEAGKVLFNGKEIRVPGPAE